MSASKQNRPRRGGSRARINTSLADIKQANKVSDADFVKKYMRPSVGWEQWTHPRTGDEYTLSLKRAGNLSKAEMDTCFELLAEMSGPDYMCSQGGWHPSAKKEEMDSPDLRYILVKANGANTEESIQGFASLMPTFEDQVPVIYCYEMQLRPAVQGVGLGRRLMNYVLATAANTPSVVGTMLTCFVHNQGARRFYEWMGFVVDESSPRDRKLRSGKVIAADYVILSCKSPSTAEID
ncbi:hypothetical protein ACO1O0_003260 [Amphichorda felina]